MTGCQPWLVLAAFFLWPSQGLGCFLVPKMLTQIKVPLIPHPLAAGASQKGTGVAEHLATPQWGQSAHEKQGVLCAWP